VSPLAGSIIESDCGLRISPVSRLRAADAQVSLLIDAMTDSQRASPRVVDTLTSGTAGAGATRMTLIRVDRDRFEAYFEGPLVIVLLEAAVSRATAAAPQLLAGRFRLTAAEGRVVHGLAAGLTVQQIADKSELSRETIRNQLKSVFSKVGVTRQVDLIRLATQFAPRTDADR
jgi:DNA-binding CsgD family transcriptional regulator